MTLSNEEVKIVAAWVRDMISAYHPDDFDCAEKELMEVILEEANTNNM